MIIHYHNFVSPFITPPQLLIRHPILQQPITQPLSSHPNFLQSSTQPLSHHSPSIPFTSGTQFTHPLHLRQQLNISINSIYVWNSSPYTTLRTCHRNLQFSLRRPSNIMSAQYYDFTISCPPNIMTSQYYVRTILCFRKNT